MNKKQIIENVREVLGGRLTQKGAETAVNVVFQSVVNGLARDGEVAVSGFGTFKAAPVPQRIRRNPRNGAELLIPAHRRVAFKAAKPLREAVNGGG